MILKENHVYTFCTKELESGDALTYKGAFLGYDYIGSICFLKFLTARSGRTSFFNPNHLIWIESTTSKEFYDEEHFDDILVKERRINNEKSN